MDDPGIYETMNLFFPPSLTSFSLPTSFTPKETQLKLINQTVITFFTKPSDLLSERFSQRNKNNNKYKDCFFN